MNANMVKFHVIALPKEFRKATGSLSREPADKLDVREEEGNVDMVLKLVGGVGTKDAGALAVVTSVMDGKVQSVMDGKVQCTMYTIRGAKFGSTFMVSKLLAGTDQRGSQPRHFPVSRTRGDWSLES